MKKESYTYPDSEDVISLPGKIFGPLRSQNVLLVFDPGAYRTIIKTSLTDSLGYQADADSKRVATSSVIGKEYGYTLKLQKLNILGFSFADIEVASFDLPEKYAIDGLIGLDLLKKFEILWRHKDRFLEFRLL